ncbi:hypothetical protein imdm_265 [gamma proteobacterium IMCC2047]|nr:hypothetical protein imdm_265 [gamma proteobacterium IMCC2047]
MIEKIANALGAQGCCAIIATLFYSQLNRLQAAPKKCLI